MKIKSILLICVLSCFQVNILLAQDESQKFLDVETGMIFFDGNMSNMDYVRGTISYYYPGYSTNSLKSFSYKSFAGVKGEITSVNKKFGLLAGVRYSRITSLVKNNTYWNTSSDYFYCLYKQDSTNTEYLKVKNISQNSDYVSIPVEIRVFAMRRTFPVSVFFKLGAELNYLIQSQTNVDFYDNTMNQYESDIADKVDKPRSSYAAFYTGLGLKVGRDLKPTISVEANVPFLISTKNSLGLIDPDLGGGFQINVQIPLTYLQK